MSHITSIMETGVAKYDKFAKHLHISLIKYVENMWNKITATFMNYWHLAMERIEPTLLKMYSHVEGVVWNISKEIFGK